MKTDFRKILKEINECTPEQKAVNIHGIHFMNNGERVEPKKKLNFSLIGKNNFCEVV